MTTFRTVFVALILGSALSSSGSGQDWQSTLRADYEHKTFTLRGFPSGERLDYGADGKLVNGGKPGPWTLDGQVVVGHLEFRDDYVQLDCVRQHLWFKDDKVLDLPGRGKKLLIVYRTGNAGEEQVRSGLRQIFLTPAESLEDAVPELWKPFVHKHLADVAPNRAPTERAASQPAPQSVGYEKVGGAVSAPRVIYSPDPKYEPLAQKASFQGTVVLWMVVNAAGVPEQIRLSRPLGMGLDEKAIEAVEKWRFTPARKNGVPVPVQINVEVNFRLY